MSTKNTVDDNSLQRFPLKFESPTSADEEISQALTHNWVRGYRTLVLRFNKVGLMPYLKFTKRPPFIM